MARVRWMPGAESDLEAIRDYFHDAPGYGKLLAGEITRVVRRLESFPRSGRMVPEVGDEAIRELIYRGYRIVYVVTADDAEVDILTVFHSSRPLEGLTGR